MAKTSNEKSAPLPESLDQAPIGPVRVFRDTVFTSRTLILPSGACLAVAKGQACAFDDEQYHYLDAHTDFEPLTE